MKGLNWTLIENWIILSIAAVAAGYSYGDHPECPYDINASAENCLQPYNMQINALHTIQQLYSGVDVEIIRSVCTALWSSVTCLKELHTKCPETRHDDIEAIMSNIYDMFSLCSYPSIFDIYARHMSCYTRHSAYSQQCYEKFRATTVDTDTTNPDDVSEMCTNLEEFEARVQTNIEIQCQSQEAADLVKYLIKPTVTNSPLCIVIEEEDSESEHPPETPVRPTDPSKAAEWVGNSGSQQSHSVKWSIIVTSLLTSLVSLTHCQRHV